MIGTAWGVIFGQFFFVGKLFEIVLKTSLAQLLFRMGNH